MVKSESSGNTLNKKVASKSTPILTKPRKTLPPTTTAEEDLITSGQRRINLIWEFTQGLIALAITGAVIYACLNKIQSNILDNAFFLIVSMYFVRTNHTLIGGVGKKVPTSSR